MKVDKLIDKLIFYFNLQVDKTIRIHEQLEKNWKDLPPHEPNNTGKG